MDSSFNIIGIDPGNNTGVCIFQIDSNNLNILSTSTLFYKLDDISNQLTNDVLLQKILYLKEIVYFLSNTYNPIVVGIESAFMNVRFPTAIINLSQYVGTLELEFKLQNSFTKILKYTPKYIKSIIATGDANKDDMYKGISNIEELRSFINKMHNLTEHQVDAIAIGYAVLMEIRKYPLLPISL